MFVAVVIVAVVAVVVGKIKNSLVRKICFHIVPTTATATKAKISVFNSIFTGKKSKEVHKQNHTQKISL